MKTTPLAIIVVITGLAAGGGAAFVTAKLTDPAVRPMATASSESLPPTFTPTGKILAPLVFPDGRLAGYVSFEAQLEILPDKVDFVHARLPLLLHAINMRTYHAPMASGPDGMLPELSVFKAVVAASAAEAFGAGIVRRVAITQAVPT